ncbi:MAG: pyrimidine operon attenuation protein/uracil phosphoribosyltransferase [Granulosicoccus sp.]|jgi:pyrimidine operon attenuation protein/uracil phosphoribosyltransferase
MSAERRTIVDKAQLGLMIDRICHQLIEDHDDFLNTVILGLQPRGVVLAQRVHSRLKELTGNSEILFGKLDATLNRDDLRRREIPILPADTSIDFQLEDKRVVLVDDVLFTGRTIRAGLDAMLSFGRPRTVELLVLIDRRFSRQLPIEPKYVGTTIDTISSERVEVSLLGNDEDSVTLFSESKQ